MEKIYFANKVFQAKDFYRYAFYHDDQIGCHVDNSYFIDNKIYAFKLVNGMYVSADDEKYYELEAPLPPEGIIWCNSCEYGAEKPFSHDCRRRPNVNSRCIGVANVSELTDFFGKYDINTAFKIIDEYNSLQDDSLIPTDYDEEYNSNIAKTRTRIIKYIEGKIVL